MLAEYKPSVKWGLWVGLFLQAICGPLLYWRIQQSPDPHAVIADPTNLAIAVLLLGGIYCWALGCGDLARAKGHAESTGSLLSLLSLFGLFILWVLPDRHPFDAYDSRRFAPTLNLAPAVAAAPAAPAAPPPAAAAIPPPAEAAPAPAPLPAAVATVAATGAPTVPLAGPEEDGGWYYANAGEALGPVSDQVILEMAKSGFLRRSDLVWKSGQPDWLPAEVQLGDVFKTVAPIPATRPLTQPPAMQAAEASDASLVAELTRSAPKISLFSWAVALPLLALILLGVAVLILWPKYSGQLWPSSGQTAAPANDKPPQSAPAKPAAPPPAPTPAAPAAVPAPAAAPAQPEDAAKPAAVLAPPPEPKPLPTSSLTGAYRRIDPAPLEDTKTHTFSRAELTLQQLNPRLLQFDVRLKWAAKAHVRASERELKGVAKGQSDSFAYDYIDTATAGAAAGHCLEFHFQEGNARLTVPQNAPPACQETSAVAGLYARGTGREPRSSGYGQNSKRPSQP